MTSDRQSLILLVSLLLALFSFSNPGTLAAATGQDVKWQSSLPNTQIINYSGEVYVDTNRNGIREFSEEGIEGVTVTLETLDGEIIQQTETGMDGEYLFTHIPDQGEFRVRIWPINGHQITVNGNFIISTHDPQGLISRSTGLFRGIYLPMIHRS
jgi:hypothetical protein